VTRARKIFRPAFAVLAFGALGAAALAIRSYVRAAGMTHGERLHVPPNALDDARRDVPGLVDVSFRTSDGLLIKGWYAPGSNRAAVILVHGGGGNRLQLFPEAKVLARHGYGILVYDTRASGESEGDLVTWGDREQRDVEAAIDLLVARPDIDPSRIALLGHSIGASTVALAAAKDQRVRALVLYATWTSLHEEIASKSGHFGPISWGPVLFRMRRDGVDVDAVRPIDVIGKIHPRPLMLVTGTEDRDTPVSVMQRMFEAAGDPKTFWVVQGADHGTYFATAPAEWETRVVGFLDGALQ
jgi:dipeptidyl aminopeptidase/acylaminoacyl peptidase